MPSGDSPEDEDDKTVFLPPERKDEITSEGDPPKGEGADEDDDEKTVFVPREAPSQSPSDAPLTPTPAPAPPPIQAPLTTGFDASSAPPDPSAFPSGASLGDASIQPIAVGDYVNVFRIERFIAKGGMGEVYEAKNPHPPHESVAVKLMLSDLANDQNALEMFYKEASALGRVHHESIVQYRIASQGPNGQPYLITEFVPGPSLQEMLGELTLDEAQLKDLTKRLSRGLGAAHREDVVHRDIAPDNVLLTQGNPQRPKIIDFGIVKDTHENGKTIIGDGFAGKLRYVAPEQLGEYDFNVGPWTDIYSLALTMLAVASGKHADMGSSLSDAVKKRIGVPDLTAFPEGLRPAFERALQPDPANRPQTMEAFAKLLDEGPGSPSVSSDTKTNPEGTDPFAPMAPDTLGEGKQDDENKSGGSGILGAAAGPNRKLIYAGVGGFLALALLIGILVMATSPDEIDDPVDESVEAGPVAQEPSKPSMEQVAKQAADQAECAWLTFEGSDGNTARFSGGAARQGAVLRGLQAAFSANGYPSVTLDTSNVVQFGQNLCAMVDALQAIRSDTPLVSSQQANYTLKMQPARSFDNREVNIAKPVLNVSGLNPTDGTMLFYIDGDKAAVFGPDKEYITKVVNRLDGQISDTGFEFALEFDSAGNYALVMLAGPEKSSVGSSKFPDGFIPTGEEMLPIDTDQKWASQFEQGAREAGWKADILWFRITDDK